MEKVTKTKSERMKLKQRKSRIRMQWETSVNKREQARAFTQRTVKEKQISESEKKVLENERPSLHVGLIHASSSVSFSRFNFIFNKCCFFCPSLGFYWVR